MVDDEQWLAYWILYSFLTLTEMVAEPVLHWYSSLLALSVSSRSEVISHRMILFRNASRGWDPAEKGADLVPCEGGVHGVAGAAAVPRGRLRLREVRPAADPQVRRRRRRRRRQRQTQEIPPSKW